MAFLEGVTVLRNDRKRLIGIGLAVISMGLAGSAGGSMWAAEGLRVGRTGPPAAWNSVSQSVRYLLWFRCLRSNYETRPGGSGAGRKVGPGFGNR